MPWKRLALIPLSIGACAWSMLTYILLGWPEDKKVYRANFWGWLGDSMTIPFQEFDTSERRFHELKNVLVEYVRANSQVAAKAFSLYLVLGWLGCFIFGLLSLVLFLA